MPREFLTPRGYSSRERILTQAARLVYEKGVQGTSLDDIRAATAVMAMSSSRRKAMGMCMRS